jgi:hypothetical protein
MKTVVMLAVLAFALPVHAQDKKPAAKEAKEAKKAPVHTSKRQEDARHCLEKGNNTDIIKCAEAYL